MIRSSCPSRLCIKALGLLFYASLGGPKAPKAEPQISGKASFSGMYPQSIIYIYIYNVIRIMYNYSRRRGKRLISLALEDALDLGYTPSAGDSEAMAAYCPGSQFRKMSWALGVSCIWSREV